MSATRCSGFGNVPPNHAVQRLERFGQSAKGIEFHPMELKAAGRVRWAAHESTAPQFRFRTGIAHRTTYRLSGFAGYLGVPRAESLSLGR